MNPPVETFVNLFPSVVSGFTANQDGVVSYTDPVSGQVVSLSYTSGQFVGKDLRGIYFVMDATMANTVFGMLSETPSLPQ